jgi:hypothetical protein
MTFIIFCWGLGEKETHGFKLKVNFFLIQKQQFLLVYIIVQIKKEHIINQN